MKVSHSELNALIKRAFEGIGYGPGDYEDAAQMVVWLESHGLGGLNELQRGLPYLTKRACTPVTLAYEEASLSVIDGGGNSVLSCGALAVDMAYTKARRFGYGMVQLRNCHNRKLIVERLVNCSLRGMSCVVHWQNGSNPLIEHYVSMVDGDSGPTYRQDSIGDCQVGDRQTLNIVCSTNINLCKQLLSHQIELQSKGTTTVTSEDQTACHAASLENGIEMNKTLLVSLEALLEKILVESTEQSRKGAGE